MTLAFSAEDIPAAEPAFDFDRVGNALAKLLQSQRSHAFVLGLHGPWGSGKTTLMGAVERALDPSAVIIPFNAWKYAGREPLWRALILAVIAAVKDKGANAASAEQLQRSLYEGFTVKDRGGWTVDWTALLAESVSMLMRAGAAGLLGGPAAASGALLNRLFGRKAKPDDGKTEDAAKSVERMAGILKREVTERTIQHVISIEQFLDQFRALLVSLGPERRIFVMIDDLDRCLPDAALEIFEAIKLFLDAEQCTYVVALDRDVIRRGLAVRYAASGLTPVDPDEYIEKTITLSFDVPLLSGDDASELLRSCSGEVALTPEQVAAAVSVLGAAPRRLKRFARLLRLLAELKAGAPPQGLAIDDLFLKLALLSYCNSSLFSAITRDPAIAYRLQAAVTRANGLAANQPTPSGVRKSLATSLESERAEVQAAMDDSRVVRALSIGPAFDDRAPQVLLQGLHWFRAQPTP